MGVFTGSKGSLKMNGVKIGFIGGITGNIENTLTEVDVIDQLEVGEFAETGHKATFSCTYFKVDANAAAALGWETGNLRDLLAQPEMTAEVFDAVGDTAVYNDPKSRPTPSPKTQISFSGVKWGGGSFSLNARGVYEGTFNFSAKTGSGL